MIGLLAGAGGAYALYRWYTPNAMACPDTKTLDAMVQKIRTGETTEATAEIMAKSYDANGCPDAAKALRMTIVAHKAYAATKAGGKAGPAGGLFSPGTPGGLTIAPPPPAETLPAKDPDQFAVANIPDGSVRYLVQTMLAKDPCAWTNEDFDYYTLLEGTATKVGKILQSFMDAGAFIPGAHRVDMVTAMNDLSRQFMAAWACRGPTASPPSPPPAGSYSFSIGGSGGFST